MGNKDLLFQTADRQQGYFTTKQAEACGYSRSNIHRYLASGEWIKVCRGIYRLSFYPLTARPELVPWALWSRSKTGQVQGTWSHETALDIYGLSDVMPAKMHMTIPKRFRKNTLVPKVLVLHRADLSDTDIRTQQGYRVTTPLRTLQDIVVEGSLSEDLIVQAVKEALRRGLVSRQELTELGNPEIAVKFVRLINEYKI